LAAGVALLRVADRAGFVDVFAGEADLCGGRGHVLLWNMPHAAGVVLARRHLAPLLRRVVLVREPALGKSLIQIT
jgi:hypothetical protein